MAERLRCPPHIEPRATASLIGVLESTPIVGGPGPMVVRADLGVGNDTFALVARGPTCSQLSAARPGDCLLVHGKLELHANPVAGKNLKVITIDVDSVTIEWRARTNVPT